ncbi:MAG: hypothetical protein JXR77_08870, partial [Lentisphaeria bacterium]|nr:hypothetical protein [Lentisphaeria bacterium]
PPRDTRAMPIRRLTGNPILHPGLSPEIGTNLNGPSLIRAPDWGPTPLARYYLYFAHHGGNHVRLALADSLSGPWRIHPGGVLDLAHTSARSHIASPDVHVDPVRQEVRLYFHGCAEGHQKTFLATSRDGVRFRAQPTVLGPFYLRAFPYAGAWYGIAKDRNAGGVLLRSPDGLQPFETGPAMLPRLRHAAVRRRGRTVDIVFSRAGDCPERLLLSSLELEGNWTTWHPTEPRDLLVPEEPWEGAELPLEPSRSGAVHAPARQLRDPAVFAEAGRTYLLYSVAGESGIAIAEWTAVVPALPDRTVALREIGGHSESRDDPSPGRNQRPPRGQQGNAQCRTQL